jgi:hypothetical protein
MGAIALHSVQIAGFSYHSPLTLGEINPMKILINALPALTLGTIVGTTYLAIAPSAKAAAIVDSVNADKSPTLDLYKIASEVGWFYTPTFSYTLNGINTKFSSSGTAIEPTVTVEVYDGDPFFGAPLLRSADFTGLANVFSGGTFADLNLLAGKEYFIGFRNVKGLGYNFTGDPGATSLFQFVYGLNNDGTYPEFINEITAAQPILQFVGNATPVPTPTLLPALLGIGVSLLRKRKDEVGETSTVDIRD